MSNAIQLSGLCKSFGNKQAVQHLDLTVPQGALYGIIGPNGAGKSTSLRMMLSILFPDSGSITVLGKHSALEAKDRIGYLPEERGVYRKMKVAAFLQHMGILKSLSRPAARQRAAEWLERVGLADVAGKRCEELSKGMQQKVQFIASVLHEPELLILDEPFSGLDPVNMRLLRELILEQHARGCTVLFSTHVMPQAEQICEHIVMIHNGRKVLDDTLTDIRARYTPHALHIAPLDPAADVAGKLEGLHGLKGMRREPGHHLIELDPAADLALTLSAIAQRVPPARLEVVRPSLEDIFVAIVSDDAPATELAA